ncbi:MAG: histidine--tRNA ligase [Spirochaetales bacterium]|nr:histidine--tRNA ligase [Spirochaetales bacterium]
MQINPRILKGFRDSLPEQEIIRRDMFHNLEKTFRSYGFMPIDTPALEYKDVLLGKGGGETDKQVYEFTDKGNREVALRFDLTVPFARFMAMHSKTVNLPFKRYHMAKVWRGENTQKGRYREFYQCDFDIVGLDNASSDFEILLLIMDSLKNLGIEDFTIHLSHRGLLNAFLSHEGISEKSVEILRCVDKLKKAGTKTTKNMLEMLVGSEKTKKILEYITTGHDDPLNKGSILDNLIKLSGGPSKHSKRLQDIIKFLHGSGKQDKVILDPSITRGLDYYTGVVFETFLNPLPGIGSICSGGRYNDLASLYTREQIPGVGASIGLDRLLAAITEPEMKETLTIHEKIHSDVMIFCMDESLAGYYAKIADCFRKKGIKVDIFHAKKKLVQQFKYAEKKQIGFAVIAGGNEFNNNTINMKNLKTFEEIKDISVEKAITLIKNKKL